MTIDWNNAGLINELTEIACAEKLENLFKNSNDDEKLAMANALNLAARSAEKSYIYGLIVKYVPDFKPFQPEINIPEHDYCEPNKSSYYEK